MDAAGRREPDAHRAGSDPGQDSSLTPAGSALGEQPAYDLWSLPLETPTEADAAPDSASFVEAWMHVLARGTDTPAPRMPASQETGPAGSPARPSPAQPAPPSPGSRSSGRRAVLVAVALSALAGSGLLLVIAGLSALLPIGDHGSSAAPPPSDDRVTVPGPSADCLVWLVKPRPDGSTYGVPGTCFAVG